MGLLILLIYLFSYSSFVPTSSSLFCLGWWLPLDSFPFSSALQPIPEVLRGSWWMFGDPQITLRTGEWGMVLSSGNTASGAGHLQRCCCGGEQHFWESLLNNFCCAMRLKNPKIYFICNGSPWLGNRIFFFWEKEMLVERAGS